MESILTSSGQKWKITIFYSVLTVSIVLTSGGQFFGKLLSIEEPFFVNVIGILLGIAVFLFACFAIRCPSCHDKWFWRAISKQRCAEWIAWLNKQNKCPNCHQNVTNVT